MIKYFKIFVLIIFQIILIQSTAFALNQDDCRSSSFYIKNINVDFTKNSIIEARSLAEQKARLIALNRLLHRLTLKNKNLIFKKSKILQLVDFLKINNEANSNTRYIANFDVCFNRDLVIKFFHKNKLQYAESYKEPISVLPIFKGPRGFILWDKKDTWYSLWKDKLGLIDGLVKLKLAKGNLYLNRNITTSIISNSDEAMIKKLVANENTKSVLFVIAEPDIQNDGKKYLRTYTKLFNSEGKLENIIYRNKIALKNKSSIYSIEKKIFHDEVSNILNFIERNWKKDNLIDPNIVNQVDLWIPISLRASTKLEKTFVFNDKSIKVKSTSGFMDKGIIDIGEELILYKDKRPKSFEKITRSLLNTKKKIEYKKDAVILQKNIETWPLSINILKGLPFVTEVKIVSISKHGGRIIVKFLGNKKTFFHATYEKGLFFKNSSNNQYILSK
ncbi:hypothetical protein N8Z28_00395 [bacterium]|nr:hypothetical protein [bacterium]